MSQPTHTTPVPGPVLVLLDDASQVRSGVAEGLTQARDLGAPVVAVATSEPTDSVLQTLGEYGVADVLCARLQSEVAHLSTAVAQVLAAAVASHKPAAVILTSSFANKEIAAEVAWRTGSGLLIDVARVQWTGGAIRGHKRSFAGTWEADCETTSTTAVLTLSPNSVTAAPATHGQRPQVTDLDVPVSVPGGLKLASRTEHDSAAQDRPALAEAAIVVAGGRGTLGDFGPVEELADALGAAVGTTRDCVDEGWMPHDAQIGQTGITIAPRLYIGAGISGAPHHHGGMQASGVIVAVNTDPDAPLAAVADVVVVGDLHDVLPAAAAAIKQAQGN